MTPEQLVEQEERRQRIRSDAVDELIADQQRRAQIDARDEEARNEAVRLARTVEAPRSQSPRKAAWRDYAAGLERAVAVIVARLQRRHESAEKRVTDIEARLAGIEDRLAKLEAALGSDKVLPLPPILKVVEQLQLKKKAGQ